MLYNPSELCRVLAGVMAGTETLPLVELIHEGTVIVGTTVLFVAHK